MRVAGQRDLRSTCRRIASPSRSLLRLAFLLVCGYSLPCAAQEISDAHPLDPLTPQEISTTVSILQASHKIGADSRFASITLQEPPKDEVLHFTPESPIRRQAFAIVYESTHNATFEAVVDLKGRQVLSWRKISGVQPSLLIEEYGIAGGLVRADPRWQAAMRRRGITDLDDVYADGWAPGYVSPQEANGDRWICAVPYYTKGSSNEYARPIEGVLAYVDLNTKKVVKVVDTGVVPIAKAPEDFGAISVEHPRTPPTPLQIVQPQGPSFEVHGHEVRWQRWRFRFAVNAREGLVLYTVGYEDGGRVRSILYRASVSETVMPYGDPSPTWSFRNAFDEGEYGLGRLAEPLVPLTDCPPNTRFFDAVLADDRGRSYTLPRAVGLYERDGGLLWKHALQSRRARELVLTFMTTIGNYDYGFNWIFHQDGTLEQEIDLTGIMLPKGVAQTTDTMPAHGGTYGHLVAPNILAVHHQHFFNFRLDMDIDGEANSVLEMNTAPVPPDPRHPYRGFGMHETLLRTEQEASRQLNMASSRRWKIINPSVHNALGQPVGYTLVPGENAIPYAAPGSEVRRRAGFLSAPLWVTQYDPAQRYAAGAYVDQSPGGDGLHRWIHANRPLNDRDIVLWYTVGITHTPRPEEWPVMPVHRAGFQLVPSGFFARNPALDVPKPE